MEESGKEQKSKEERLRFLKLAREKGITETCQQLGVARSTYYYWERKLEKEGEAGLGGRSGGKNKGKREIEEWKRKEVLSEKEENPGYGVSQIRNQLRRRRITISSRSIRQILEEAGYVSKKEREKKEWQRFEAGRPLELVQIDITEFYLHKQRVYLVLLLDDHSRFLLGFRLIEECNMEEIQGLVDEAINRYGKMESILSDRGFVFHGWRGINRFEKHLDELDIYHIHTSPHHPETIGKLEAVNKAVQKELLRQVEFKDISEGREKVERWIWGYNYKRVHQGLRGVMVPAERFHGWVKEVDRELAKMVEEGIRLEGREISLVHVKMINSEVEITIMGQKIKLA